MNYGLDYTEKKQEPFLKKEDETIIEIAHRTTMKNDFDFKIEVKKPGSDHFKTMSFSDFIY